jgi:hypothetical protein
MNPKYTTVARATRIVYDASRTACEERSTMCFELNETGNLIVGGDQEAAEKWLHEAVRHYLLAAAARGTMHPRTSPRTLAKLDRELEDIRKTIEAHAYDLNELEDIQSGIEVASNATLH